MNMCTKAQSRNYVISSFFLFISLSVLGVFLFFSLFPYRIAHIDSPAEVVSKEVVAGEALEYRFKAVVFNPYPVVEVRRIITNGVDYIMQPTNPPTPKTGHVDSIVRSNIIPEGIPPGRYKIRFEAVHKVNPVRTMSVFWETEAFMVIE